MSSRQGEGGSLPSNVNTRSAEVHPFIAEMAAVPRRRGHQQKNSNNNNNNGSESGNEYEMGLMNGDAPKTPPVVMMSKAAARSVAARGTSVGLDTDIPYAQMDSGMSVIINMGDSGPEDHDGDQSVMTTTTTNTTAAKKVTSHVSICGSDSGGIHLWVSDHSV